MGSKGILVTADGGVHWRLQHAVSSFYDLAAVTFADARHGWAVGGTGDAPAEPGFVMTTRDGGVHWTTTLLSGAVDRLNGVSFVDALHGWVVGNRGVVYRTRDGGRSWVLGHVNAYWELGAVAFSDARHGWPLVHPTGPSAPPHRATRSGAGAGSAPARSAHHERWRRHLVGRQDGRRDSLSGQSHRGDLSGRS